MTAPLVTVVVPTRNRSRLLTATLRGVLRQRDVELEVVVVDEASTDDTAAAVAAFRDPRVRVVRHDVALGVSGARNRGVAESRGTWVAFVDDDDLWAPDKLFSQLEAAKGEGRKWAYAGSVSISDTGQLVYGRPPLPPHEMTRALRGYNAIPGGGSNVVVRRSLLEEVGPFDVRLRNTEDWEMWLRLAAHGLPAWVCRPLMAYRVHPANASLDIAEIVRGARLIEQLHGTSVDWGHLHRWLAESCLRVGRRRQALGQFVQASVRGQAAGVVSDVTAILGRRLARSRGRSSRSASSTSEHGWLGEAADWLRDLEEGAMDAPSKGSR